MKELMLWRHGKSSWATPGLEDFDRPLNKRGIRSAEAVARWLTTRHLAVDHVLCSPSVRTRQTLDRLLAMVADAPPIQFDRRLYLAECGELLRRLQDLPAAVTRALMVGHNEGIWELAVALAEVGPVDQLASLREKYPTGALAWLRLPIDSWSELGSASGELIHFVRPRDIVEETS